jgi:PAS domain-containing protein
VPPDGEYRWFLVRISPLCDGRGNIVKWHGVLTDIEDRKRAEQALKRSEAYLAEAQELTKTGSWARDPHSEQMVYCSDGIYRIFGLDKAEGTQVLKHLYNGYTPMIAPWLGFKAYRAPKKRQSMHLNTEFCWPTAPSRMSGLCDGRYWFWCRNVGHWSRRPLMYSTQRVNSSMARSPFPRSSQGSLDRS